MSIQLEERLASLPPEKRRLLELRLRKEGLGAGAARPATPPAIPRRDPADAGPFPLTFGQQRLWFIEQLNPGAAVYNIPFAGRLRGALDAGLLEHGLREVVRRHEVLRTRFRLRDGQPVQVIDPEPFVRLPLIDLTALPRDPREAEAARLILAEPHASFDLERGPVLRVSLVKVGSGEREEKAPRPHVGTLHSQLPGLLGGGSDEPDQPGKEEHVLLVTMPHLVTDAWSMGVLFRELPAIYEGLRRGEVPRLPELPIQVADYALWQRAWLQGEVLEEHLRFWREYLRDAPPVLALPTDRPRPPVQTFQGKRLPMALPPEVQRGLRPFNERRGVTSFMTLLAILDVLLQRWSGLDDIVIGSPVVTRQQPETHPLIGFFINTAVLRTRLHGDPTFEELLLRVRDSTLASLAHQDLPFERLTEVVEVPRDSPYPPLVQVSYVLQNVHIPHPEFEGIRLVDSWQTDTGMARFDLGVGVFEEEGEGTVPQGGFDYNTDLFDETTILRMRGHFVALAMGALAEPGRRISELPLHSAAERQQLLVEWNDAAAPPLGPSGRLFHEIVTDLARLRPEAPAVVGPDGAISYAELARRVEELAARLRRHLSNGGAGPEVGVAVCLERSPERIVAFLAVLAAGGFYLPLDPDWPAERLRYQISDAGAAVVVTTRELAERLGFGEEGEEGLVLVAPHPLTPSPTPSPLPGEGEEEKEERVGGEGLAYVFYTSGSTGRPKGVMISHRGLINLAVAVQRAFGEAPGEGVLQVAAPGFDASILEMAMALPAGRVLHVATPGALLAGPELAGFAAERAATGASLTPTALASVPDGSLAALRCVVMGGEACPPDLAARWASRVSLFNNYGPTETTVCCTAGRVEPGLGGLPRPPIGRPHANLRIYVVDARLEPVPLGAHGELCVGGPSLARGYLGRPELTAASFVPDPFSGEPGARLYRTGDRARHLPDGRLDFLGRFDDQVKVRGIRIEPGEIEALLLEHPAVREAAVVVRKGDGRLMACIVLAGLDGETSQTELRSWLRERLPEPMMPAAFVLLDALPFTANNKLDRRALSRLEPEAPEAGIPAATSELPSTDKERLLADIWASALKRDQVGLHDDFFALGGDSILAIQVVSRAAEAGLFVEPRQLFAHPTVAGLAAVAAGAPRIDAEQGPVTGLVPLTPAQLWLLEEVDLPVPQHWNLSLLLEADAGAAPDPAALARAVARLIEHHDQLRARFFRTGAGWRQEIAPPSETPEAGAVPFTLFDLSALPESAREAAFAAAAGAVQAGFDLQRGPLLRAALFVHGSGPVRLLLVVHHLVVDGVSWPVLLADLRAAAAGLPLPPKTTSFRRWAERLREYARTAELRQELDFWREAGDRAAPLPADFAAGLIGAPPLEGAAGRVEVRLDAAETRRLVSEVPEAWPVRTEEVLLTAVAEALAEWRGERTAVLAVEGHGRERLFDDVDLSRTVGWLTSTWPLRLELPEGGPGESLKAVKERLRRVPRRGIGYGLLRHLADGDATAALGRQPRPDVSFNYLGRTDDSAAGSGPFRLAPEPGGGASDPRNPRPHPLAVDAVVLGGELRLVWIYDRGRWLPETVERVAAAALGHLRGLITHCLGGEASGHTPVDFPHAGLGAEQLDRLMGKIGRQRR